MSTETVAVLGVIAAFALHYIAQLQVSAHLAQVETTAAQMRSVAALAHARCAHTHIPSATVPTTVTPTPALRKGVASEVDPPDPSCP